MNGSSLRVTTHGSEFQTECKRRCTGPDSSTARLNARQIHVSPEPANGLHSSSYHYSDRPGSRPSPRSASSCHDYQSRNSRSASSVTSTRRIIVQIRHLQQPPEAKRDAPAYCAPQESSICAQRASKSALALEGSSFRLTESLQTISQARPD